VRSKVTTGSNNRYRYRYHHACQVIQAASTDSFSRGAVYQKFDVLCRNSVGKLQLPVPPTFSTHDVAEKRSPKEGVVKVRKGQELPLVNSHTTWFWLTRKLNVPGCGRPIIYSERLICLYVVLQTVVGAV